MFTTKEAMYINTFLEKVDRGIWAGYCQGYEVYISHTGIYKLEFKTHAQAIEFLQRIVTDNVGISMKDGVIVINKKERDGVLRIECGQNEKLAHKLVKHLRKQCVLTKREQIKQMLKEDKTNAQNHKQEIENIGIKF